MVHLQAGHLGWRTDDLLLEAINPAGEPMKAALQVKRSFSLSEADEECIRTLQSAFTDFRDASRFDQQRDILGLVTSSLSAKLARGFRTLLDCARASANAADMVRRLEIPGYLGKPSFEYYKTIRTILRGADGGAASEDELWQFLRHYQVVDLDLNVTGGIAETMLQSLLAATLPDRNQAEADTTWKELMVLALHEAGNARSFTRESLPPRLLQRHARATGFSHGIARLLKDSEVVVDGIRTTIAEKTSVPRRELASELFRLIQTSPLVFVTGAAGSGKSALVKSVFRSAIQDGVGFAFRAASFAGHHINEVLNRFELSLDALQAQSAMHGKKLLWVDSLERLMEKPPELRAAFLDLLRVLRNDPTWHLIVTCRDYSAETVRTALFGEVGIVAEDVEIGELNDSELDEVAVDFPSLVVPLSNPKLRSLLRNPFFLDKAAKMNWDVAEQLPTTERAFRDKVWNEVIRRVDEDMESGLPKQRGQVLAEVALRRAKALEPFVSAAELDPRALSRLVRDSILQTRSIGSDFYAPAHDVFEDWTLMRWMDETFARHERQLDSLLAELGTFPALRRAYRRWLTEYLDVDPNTTDTMVVGLIQNQRVAAHWREDTLIGILQSSDANGFLDRNKAMLLADDAKLLRQVIHILRVACRAAIPRKMFGIDSTGEFFLPKGNGWIGVGKLIETATPLFSEADISIIVGFLEDWILLTRYGLQYPEGAASIANAAWHWLPKSPWRCPVRDAEERLLRVILTIPLVAEPTLTTKVEKALSNDHPNRPDRELLKLIFNHFACNAIFRDMPDLGFRVAEHALDLNRSIEEIIADRSNYGSQAVNEAFALGGRLDIDDFPSSAFNGPYLRMLWHHPVRGVNFILRFINRACEAFAHPDNYHDFIEPPGTVVLDLPDGLHDQFGNWRLWAAYRGMNVTPNTFESALMALEYWLLEKVKREDADLERILLDLLQRSNNVAVSAVVASIAVAAPSLAGEAAYALLTCPSFLSADFDRSTQESFMGAQLGGFGIPQIDAERGLYDKERKESAKREHRERNLEHVAVFFQMTGRFRDRVWALIDRYKEELPPEPEQDEETKLWRIQLHRIDFRKFIETGRTEEGHIMIRSGEPDPDLQTMIEEQKPRVLAVNTAISLLTWGMSAFSRKAESDDWSERIAQAQELLKAKTTAADIDLATGAPAYVAAVCIRDHWTEMSSEQREWCVQMTCNAIDADADAADHFHKVAHNTMEGSRPAAFILPALFGKTLQADTQARLLPTLAKAITHAVEETVGYAMQGVGRYLWTSDRALALICVQALIRGTMEHHDFSESQREHPFTEQEPWEFFYNDFRLQLRKSIEQRETANEAEIAAINIATWPGRKIAPHLFFIAIENSRDPILQQVMHRCAALLPAIWEVETCTRQSRPSAHNNEERYDLNLEHDFVNAICRFALQLDSTEALVFLEPIFTAAPRFPEKASKIVSWLILHQGDRTPAPTLWTLWQRFADDFAVGVKPEEVDERHSEGAKMLQELFLGVNWAEQRDWLPLHGQTDRLRKFFLRLPPMEHGFACYAYYLAKAGTPTLPDAITDVAAKLQDTPSNVCINDTAVYYLEEILTRLIYGGNTHFRVDSHLRRAVLTVLDALVAAGSSPAYKLRDDFLTPVTG